MGRAVVWAVGAAAASIIGCQSRPPARVEASAISTGHSTIWLMPTVDARKDQSRRIDLERAVRKRMAGQLANKGYTVIWLEKSSDHSDALLTEMTPVELAALAPASAEAVMVITLYDLSSTNAVVYGSGKSDVGGILIERRSGRVLWQDSFAHSAGAGGVIGAIMPWSDAAVRSAVYELSKGIPARVGGRS